MALPLCPVCQNSYDTEHSPRSIHPCGHGICELCFDKYVSRGGETCPICRVHITSTSVNYDLRAMCKSPETGWRRDMARIVGRYLPGKDIVISERFCKVTPLIKLRCDWCIGSLKKARAILVDLLAELPLADVLHWITVLNFDPSVEAQLIEHVSTLMRHKEFLGNEDEWLLKLSHVI